MLGGKTERKQNIEFGMNQGWKVTSLQIPNVQRDSGSYKATRGPVEKLLGGKLVSGRHEDTVPNLEKVKFEVSVEALRLVVNGTKTPGSPKV